MHGFFHARTVTVSPVMGVRPLNGMRLSMSEKSAVKALSESIIEIATELNTGGIDPELADSIVADFAHQLIAFEFGH